MGTIEDIAKAEFGGTKYVAQFRFHFEPAKGAIVNQMSMLVENFRAFGAGAEVHPRATDDQSILLSLMRIRAHKRLGMWLWGTEETRSGMAKLLQLWQLKSRFFISVGVQKLVDGRLTGLHILRDQAAKVYIMSPISHQNDDGSYEKRASLWDLALDLSRPEILQGGGKNFNANQVRRI